MRLEAHPYLENLLDLLDANRRNLVEPLTDGVEKHQTQRDAHHGVQDGEDFARHRAGRGVAVACNERTLAVSGRTSKYWTVSMQK